VRGHGKGQPHVHPAGVALYRGIQELLDLGKGHDLVELALHLGACHPQDRAVEVNVLPPGQLGVEAGAHLQQAGHPALDRHPPGARLGDAAQDLEQRTLARAVAPDNAHGFPAPDLEAHVLDRPDLFQVVALDDRLAAQQVGRGAPEGARIVHQSIAQGRVAAFLRLVADGVFFAQVFGLDDDVSHSILGTRMHTEDTDFFLYKNP